MPAPRTKPSHSIKRIVVAIRVVWPIAAWLCQPLYPTAIISCNSASCSTSASGRRQVVGNDEPAGTRQC